VQRAANANVHANWLWLLLISIKLRPMSNTTDNGPSRKPHARALCELNFEIKNTQLQWQKVCHRIGSLAKYLLPANRRIIKMFFFPIFMAVQCNKHIINGAQHILNEIFICLPCVCVCECACVCVQQAHICHTLRTHYGLLYLCLFYSEQQGCEIFLCPSLGAK